MQIKILRNTVANKQCVRAGDVVEVDKTDGHYLIAIGAAAMLEAPAAETEAITDIPPLDEPAAPKKKRKKQGDE